MTSLLAASLVLAHATAAPAPPSQAIDTYAGGSQVGAMAVPAEGPHHYLLFPPRCYREGGYAAYYPDAERADNFYGHPDVVRAILDVARIVRTLRPTAPRLAVGELSHRDGGEIPFHHSHQNGLDVDLWYLQAPHEEGTPEHPVAVCSFGRGFEVKDTAGKWTVTEDFDPAWDWPLAATLAARSDVKVIFVGGVVRKALGQWAKSEGVPKAERKRTMARLKAVWCKPPPGHRPDTYRGNGCPHEDHFHVRFRCPAGSLDCR